jgi:peptidoglycan hydrolase FlgJ
MSATAAESTATAADNPRLKAAAHEFEASLMKEFLKPLEHDSLFRDDKSGDPDDEEGSADALMSFGSQAMATAISERGGFGIATMILSHFRTEPGAVHKE